MYIYIYYTYAYTIKNTYILEIFKSLILMLVHVQSLSRYIPLLQSHSSELHLQLLHPLLQAADGLGDGEPCWAQTHILNR